MRRRRCFPGYNPATQTMSVGQHISEVLGGEISTLAGISVLRLVLAAILGGIIGLEREFKHRPAGIRTNMFICLGSCFFTILSSTLSVDGDHTRIAAQIITGIGFIGAGSILHEGKRFVTGLTTAATIFVVAAVGMALGGGLYLTATFATAIVLLALFVIGRTERQMNLKELLCAYEVAGSTVEAISHEVNRVLEPKHALMQNIQLAPTTTHVRVRFELEGTSRVQEELFQMMRRSPLLQSVVALGPVETE